MTEKINWEILLLSKENSYDIPRKMRNINLNFTWIPELDKILTEDFPNVPDLILVKDHAQILQGGDLIFEIRRKWDQVPVVMLLETYSAQMTQELFAAGAFDIITETNFSEQLYAVLLKCQIRQNEKTENKFLITNLSSLTAHLQEKNEIFKTVVELITHDTKNNFYYISTVLSQIPDKNLKGLLDNAVHELNECILEAYGYLNGKKRITGLVYLVENLRIGKKRITLKSHPRIQLTNTTPFTLFIEVSALFKNAILNVVENALKYTPPESLVMIDLYRDGKDVIIKVSDNGNGISDENKKKIFECNFRLERDMFLEGTGKGLWITKNIIDKEEGAVYVSDNPEGGSIFYLKIPAFKVDNYKAGVARLSEWFGLPPLVINNKIAVISTMISYKKIDPLDDMDSVVFANLLQLLRDEAREKNRKHFYKKLTDLKNLNPGGKSVLIIDDSIHVHYYLAAHLTEIGYRIAGFAENGADGVSFYQALKPDLVTMDSTMPIMSGSEAAKEIIDLDQNAHILFITGVGEHPRFISTLQNTIPEKNYRIIKKPFKKEDLESTLNDLF